MRQLLKQSTLPPEILQSIGYISLTAGSIEYFLEQTILALKGENVSEVVPSTDCKPVSKLIKEFETLIAKISSEKMKEIVRCWCAAAPNAFVCRNAILHGQCLVFSSKEMMFITNTAYRGEVRKRESKSFNADGHISKLMADVFSNLLDSIMTIYLFSTGSIQEKDLKCVNLIATLSNAASTTNELANLAEAVNNEKY